MIKMNVHFVTGVGQKMSPRQESNPWPLRHRLGALKRTVHIRRDSGQSVLQSFNKFRWISLRKGANMYQNCTVNFKKKECMYSELLRNKEKLIKRSSSSYA